MANPSQVAQQVQKIQVEKEAAAQKANAEVMTDANALHAVHTAWTAPPTIAAAAIGVGGALVAGAALPAVVVAGAALAAVEHFRPFGLAPLSWLSKKTGIGQPKAPAGTPAGSKPVPGPGVPPPGSMPTATK